MSKLLYSHYDKDKADRAVNFIQCLKHTKGIWSGKNFTLLPWKEQIIRDLFGIVKPNGYRQFNTAYISIGKKNGKQLLISTQILTTKGWSTMGELAIGDEVFDENGKPCHVVAKSAVDDTEQAYKLTFRDNSEIIAGENHLWDVEDIYFTKPRKCIYTTKQIYDRTVLHHERNKNNPKDRNRSVIRIPVAPALEMPDADLPLNPYTYGYWLGNGHSTKPELLQLYSTQSL